MKYGDIGGEIFISPNNLMKASYVLYALEDSSITTEIYVGVSESSDIESEVSARVLDDSSVNTEINIKFDDMSDICAELQPRGHAGIDTVLEIRPGNRMWALYELQEPPQLTETILPYQDAFVRSKRGYDAINYGGNNSLVVGSLDDDSYKSYVQFDFAKWNSSYVIINSKLRIHYSGIVPDNAQIELFTVNEQWYEYGITNLNKPNPVTFIVDTYANNKAERYIEFEFTELTNSWVNLTLSNYGFQIRVVDESKDTLISLRSRESNRPPELIITYYDARVYSAGRSQRAAEIFVWRTGSKDILTEIKVESVVDNKDTLTELYVHRYEVPLFNDHETVITVSKPDTHAEMTVSIQDTSDAEATLVVRQGLADRRDAVLSVSREKLQAELYIKYTNHMETELVVQQNKSSDVYAAIAVTRQDVDAEIYVKNKEDVETELIVQRHREDDVFSEVSVTREQVDTQIYIKYRESLFTEISVVVDEHDVVYAAISVTRPSVGTIITPRPVDEKDIETEIKVRAIDNSDIDTSITVTRDVVFAVLTVVESSDVDTELFVKYADTLETEITVTVFDDIQAEIDILQNSNVLTEVTATRRETLTTLMVPFWDDSDISTEIVPRILQVSDRETLITVRSLGGAYAFII